MGLRSSYGLSVCLLTTLAKCGTVHMHPRFEGKAVLDLLERERIELVPAVPAMISALNRMLRLRPRDAGASDTPKILRSLGRPQKMPASI